MFCAHRCFTFFEGLKGKMLPANLFSRTKGELCNVVAGVKEGSEWITNLLEVVEFAVKH